MRPKLLEAAALALGIGVAGCASSLESAYRLNELALHYRLGINAVVCPETHVPATRIDPFGKPETACLSRVHLPKNPLTPVTPDLVCKGISNGQVHYQSLSPPGVGYDPENPYHGGPQFTRWRCVDYKYDPLAD